jgi:hypothetical protein
VTRPGVEDARPERLVRVLNPVLKPVLASPLGRLVGTFALLEFRGRRSGRAFRVPVGLHEVEGTLVVATEAGWRRNFDGGASAIVRHRGRTRAMVGTLVTDPEVVARGLNAILAGGVKPSTLGLQVPDGHVLTADDVRAVRRVLIELRPA